MDPNNVLVDAIKNNISKGFTTEQIKLALLQKGWPSNQVDEAFRLFNQNIKPLSTGEPKSAKENILDKKYLSYTGSEQQKKRPRNNILLIIGIILIFIILVAGAYIVFNIYSKPALIG